MTQLVQCLLCKHGDMNLAPRSQVKNKTRNRYDGSQWNPSAEETGSVKSWNSLLSHSNLDKHQANERSCLKIQVRMAPEEWTIAKIFLWPPQVHAYIHEYAHTAKCVTLYLKKEWLFPLFNIDQQFSNRFKVASISPPWEHLPMSGHIFHCHR